MILKVGAPIEDGEIELCRLGFITPSAIPEQATIDTASKVLLQWMCSTLSVVKKLKIWYSS